MKHINSLDGARAIGLLMIMLFHCGYITPGYIALQFFFVLSGFLITSILLRSKEKSDFKPYLKRFFWRRTLRIFPIYYLYLLAIGILFLLISLPANYLDALPHLVTYTFNYYYLLNGMDLDYFGADFDYFFTHCWSLSVEEQFYIIWPFIIYLIPLKKLKVLLVGIIFFSPIFRYFVGEYLFLQTDFSPIEIGEVILRLLPSQLDSLAFGALIPVYALHKKSIPYNKLLYLLFGSFLVIGFVNVGLMSEELKYNIFDFGYPVGNTFNFSHVWTYTIINALSAVFILHLITCTKDSLLSKICSFPFFVHIGKISYGMYLYHMVLIPIHFKFIDPHIDSVLISLLGYYVEVYLISLASFEIIEKYFINLKDKKFGLKTG